MNVRFPIFLLLLVASSLCASAYTEKTFLQTQPLRLPSQYLFYDYGMETTQTHTDLLGGNLQITSFCRCDHNGKAIGRYFGRNDSNVISIGSDKRDFQSANLIFRNDPDSINLKGLLALAPTRKMRGLHFSYLERLSGISDRLFLNVHVPLIHITRRMGACIRNEQAEIVEGKEIGIQHYFLGNLVQNDDPQKQAALTCSKIDPFRSESIMAFGDTECTLSYHFGNRKSYVRPVAGVVVPTSNKPKGEHLFEPLTGNGKRWGFKFGSDVGVVVHDERDFIVKLTGGVYGTYLLPNEQKRMIGFMSDDLSSRIAWSNHYGLLGEHGKTGVFPAANVLTRNVKVSKGWEFDGFLNCSMHIPNIIFSLGYSFFARGAEEVDVVAWPESTYALVSPAYDTSAPFTIVENPDGITHDNLESPISRCMLDTSVAETPATITHKIYAMVTGTWDSLPLPFSVGAGVGYEFAQDNSAMQGLELYVRVGVSF